MRVKVHTTCAAALVLAAALLSGCDRSAEDVPADEDAPDVAAVGSRFGDPYEIVTGWNPADPDVLPTVEADTLVALVGYPGGCEDHTFRVSAETARDTVRLWLRHDADGDDCEAYLRDEVRLPIPDDAHGAATLVLLNPQGGPPFVVNRVDG